MKTFSGNYAFVIAPPIKACYRVLCVQHYSSEGKEKDRMRDDYMTEAGMTVVRFSDRKVLNNLDLVLEKSWKKFGDNYD